MPRRIDLGDDDSDDSLKQAMRDLERQLRGGEDAAETEPPDEEDAAPQPPPETDGRRKVEQERDARHRESREGIQDAVEAIERDQEAIAAARAARPAASRIRWVALGILVAGAIAVAAVMLRPQPLPPPAEYPEAAVEGFWREIVAGSYEGATVYYPSLVDRFGSRKQAALHLRDLFQDNPPIEVTSVGTPEELPDSADLRVGYEVYLRNGVPRVGEFIVRYTGDPATGYAIASSP